MSLDACVWRRGDCFIEIKGQKIPLAHPIWEVLRIREVVIVWVQPKLLSDKYPRNILAFSTETGQQLWQAADESRPGKISCYAGIRESKTHNLLMLHCNSLCYEVVPETGEVIKETFAK